MTSNFVNNINNNNLKNDSSSLKFFKADNLNSQDHLSFLKNEFLASIENNTISRRLSADNNQEDQINKVSQNQSSQSSPSLHPLETYKNDIKVATNVILNTLQQYNAGELCICFDGGKDGHIVLDLICKLASSSNSKLSITKLTNKITLLNIINNPFKKCTELVKSEASVNGNLLNLIEIHDQSMVSALKKFKSQNPKIKAIFMGTRRTDNVFAEKLDSVGKTSGNYPEFILVSPILDWQLSSVWYYLIKEKVEYCELYDEGYTSLGNCEKTIKNKALKLKDDIYLPAFNMLSSSEERSNRS